MRRGGVSVTAGHLKRLIKIKREISARRPKFVQVESWRYVRVPSNWHRPRGLDDKVRKRVKGWQRPPCIGYGSPRLARDVHPSGLVEVQVHNIGDLSLIDPETQAARIGRTVGTRKRNAIVEEALRRNIRVLNLGKSRQIAELAKAETEKEEAEMPSEEDKEKAAEEVEPVPEDEDEEGEDEDK